MKTVFDFTHRLKTDRDFRLRVLAARNDGPDDLTALLAGEGYALPVQELHRELPEVRSGVKAGQVSENRE